MNKQTGIILFSCLYILGIIAFIYNYTLLCTFFVFTALLFCFFKKYIPDIKHIVIFVMIFLFGIINCAVNLKFDDETTQFADTNVEAALKVISIPTNNIKDRTKFYANVISIKNDTAEISNIKAKILVTINDENEILKDIKIGDTLSVNGRLKVPQQSKNPSQFDYYRYLQYKKTFSLIYVDKNWKITGTSDDFTGKVIRKLNDTRNNILMIHAQNIKSPMLEILGGIIFGDDAVNPDEETKTSFINSGIFHILAASGMNVTLIFGIWFFFAINLRLNYRFSIITGILLIIFYTFMTGFGPPIMRATLMLTLILIGKLLDKATSTVSLLFLVGFLMLAFNPLMLFDIGFQLSFIVTFALILTSPVLTFNFKYKFINYISGACCIPIIAQFYAAPLQMYYFNTFSVYSVLANIAIIPVLSIVSFIGFISSIIAMIAPIAQLVCKAADFILNPLLIYIVEVAKFFANLPHSIINVQKPSLIQIILYFAIIISLTLAVKFKFSKKKTIIVLAVLLISFCSSFINIPDKRPYILFFSVGNADSILIKSPDDDYFMIDTGKTGYLNSPTQAKNIMIKYLKDKGINHINSLIVTHFDSDHAGGTIDILNNVKISKLYISDVLENTQLAENINNFIKENDINSLVFSGNEVIYEKDDFKISLIKPECETIKNENQKSLIVHINYKNQNFLFMGDGDINSYNCLPKEFKENIAITKSGHHGAKETINDEMAKNTDLFIISTGPNIYNHPNPETINTITLNNSKYLRTDYHNAIKITADGNIIKTYAYSPKYRKFMHIETK